MGQYWKAILAFVALFVTNILAVVVDPHTSAIVPQTASQWVSAVVTTLVGTFLVWAKSNDAASGRPMFRRTQSQ